MEDALILQNKHWQKTEYKTLLHRDILSELIRKISLKEVQVLSGVRRGGKSSVLKLIINHLKKKQNPKSILFLNFDDPYFYKICNDPTNIRGTDPYGN